MENDDGELQSTFRVVRDFRGSNVQVILRQDQPRKTRKTRKGKTTLGNCSLLFVWFVTFVVLTLQ